MYKIKVHSGSSKRFKLTSTKKIKRKCAYKNHLLSCKTKIEKRRLSKKVLVDKTDLKKIKKMLVI
jgi:large subunit ribosomal protein L35